MGRILGFFVALGERKGLREEKHQQPYGKSQEEVRADSRVHRKVGKRKVGKGPWRYLGLFVALGEREGLREEEHQQEGGEGQRQEHVLRQPQHLLEPPHTLHGCHPMRMRGGHRPTPSLVFLFPSL